jgi:hypothetical protein
VPAGCSLPPLLAIGLALRLPPLAEERADSSSPLLRPPEDPAGEPLALRCLFSSASKPRTTLQPAQHAQQSAHVNTGYCGHTIHVLKLKE